MTSLSSCALHAVFEALSHFNPATHGEVTYREEPYGVPDWEDFWSKSGWFHIRTAGIKNHSSDYSVPQMFHALSDDECWKVISFVDSHKYSYWALDAIRGAVVDQWLNWGVYKNLVSNTAFLWDAATSRATSLMDHGDCYSYRAIRGLPDIDVSKASPEEAMRRRALVDFAIAGYIRNYCTATPSSAPVRENSSGNMIVVQEPYRSVVKEYPHQLETILRWVELTHGKVDELDKLLEMLQQENSEALAQGML